MLYAYTHARFRFGPPTGICYAYNGPKGDYGERATYFVIDMFHVLRETSWDTEIRGCIDWSLSTT